MVEVSDAISAIVDQYEFDFGLDGAICRCSYQHGTPVFDVSKEAKAGVEQLFNELCQFETRIGSLKLDPLEVSEFLGKYFRTDAKVWKALRGMQVVIRSDDIPIYDEPPESFSKYPVRKRKMRRLPQTISVNRAGLSVSCDVEKSKQK
jgi:hypothetical protein